MDKHYQKFNNIHGGHNCEEELKKINLPKDMTGLTLLDIGCSEGFYCFEATKRGCTRVVGIDINAERIKIAKDMRNKSGYTNVYFFEADLYDIVKHISKFDIVLFLSVFHHLKYPVGALKILHELTKKLLIAEIEVSGTDNIRRDGHGFCYPPKNWVITAFKMAGWNNIEEMGIGKNGNRIIFCCVK